MKYHYLHFTEIDSTNNYLKNSYKLLNNFTFVSTDYQSAGKGRNDRIWFSNPGENLMFSLLIKDENLLKKFSSLSIISAAIIAELIESLGIKDVTIKWPNDVFIKNKKICGILLEGQILEYLVIGVGLNVNQKSFPDGLRKPATSLSLELNKDLNVNEIKEQLFSQMTKELSALNSHKYLEYFKNHNYLENKRVRALVNNQPFIGEVIGIDDYFFLQIKTGDMLLHIDSGEIEILS